MGVVDASNGAKRFFTINSNQTVDLLLCLIQCIASPPTVQRPRLGYLYDLRSTAQLRQSKLLRASARAYLDSATLRGLAVQFDVSACFPTRLYAGWGRDLIDT